MAKRKDNVAPAAEAATAPAAAATDAIATKDARPPIEAIDGASGIVSEATSDGRGVDSSKIGPFQPPAVDRTPQAEAADAGKPFEASAPADAPRWRLPRHAPLAATIALAAAVGALAGAAATAGLSRDAAVPAATQALQQGVTQLITELAALKSGLNAAQRSASEDFGKIAQRLERAEKSQAEPAAKLAKLADSIERRLTQASMQAAPEVTGSVTPAKQEAKPLSAEGWRLRDFYAGRAVVESRDGTLFEVGPGSNLPGLGRVETIKREDGRVMVVTRNGVIAAALEQRTPRHQLPYRY